MLSHMKDEGIQWIRFPLRTPGSLSFSLTWLNLGLEDGRPTLSSLLDSAHEKGQCLLHSGTCDCPLETTDPFVVLLALVGAGAFQTQTSAWACLAPARCSFRTNCARHLPLSFKSCPGPCWDGQALPLCLGAVWVLYGHRGQLGKEGHLRCALCGSLSHRWGFGGEGQ